MADQADVANVLVALLDSLFYPSGDGTPSVLAIPIKTYRGWPNNETLKADLAPVAGGGLPAFLHATVFPQQADRNTTRYQPNPILISSNPHTYTLVQSGQTVTVGGAAPATYYPQNLCIFVSRIPYVVTATAGQTPAQLAAALAAAIPGASALGAVITVPAGGLIGALRVGSSATMGREVRRIEKIFQLTVWADTADHRDAMVAVFDPTLANTPFLLMPDGFAARLRYRSTADIDTGQKEGVYRRDLFYTVEYATTILEVDTEIVVEQGNLTSAVTNQLIETIFT